MVQLPPGVNADTERPVVPSGTKERITVVLCVNSDGSSNNNQLPNVVGKTLNLHCITNA